MSEAVDIQIKFDRRTRLSVMQPKMIAFPEVLPAARDRITDGLPYQVFDFFGMTVAEFLQLQEGRMPEKVNAMLSDRKTTFWEYVQLLNTFDIGGRSFEKILTDTIIPADSEEEQAKTGLIELTTEEAMLSFLKDYYGLPGLEQAQKLTLYEYITARKVMFNNAKYQRNLSNMQKSKYKN